MFLITAIRIRGPSENAVRLRGLVFLSGAAAEGFYLEGEEIFRIAEGTKER